MPAGTVLAVKGSRFITHNKKLGDTGAAMANFLASGILALDDKLGPILLQLPEWLCLDTERVDDAAYGRGDNHRLRHVLEVRHPSFLSEDIAAIARGHVVAPAACHAAAWTYTEEVTAGFVHIRLHGPDEPYASAYRDQQLRSFAQRLHLWRGADRADDAHTITDRAPPRRRARDVHAAFDNDKDGRAPRNASRLRALADEVAGGAAP